mgnify:FL=1|jgi:hypothetical protein
MTSKHLNIVAAVFFVVSQVFLFLGLDSERRSSTIPFCTAAMICLAASVVIAIFGLRRAARERRQRDI